MHAVLALEDGSLFHGSGIGAAGISSGEVVFNTAMTGYQEILTDPSYARQIITLTYPHIGNTGCNPDDDESGRVWAAGLVIRDLPLLASSWRRQQTLDEFLRQRDVVGIADIDTRRLTRHLRDKGPLNGCIISGEDNDKEAVKLAKDFPGLKGMDLAREVSTAEPYVWRGGLWDIEGGYRDSGDAPEYKVIAYDFGIKRNILRMLRDRGCEVIVVPAQTSADEALKIAAALSTGESPPTGSAAGCALASPTPPQGGSDYAIDGIFLSNGPGDPEPCGYAIEAVKEFLRRRIPLFGICLGCQFLALACGAKTLKMRLGHHGANHPVQDLSSGRVMITSQNHGFAVDGDSLPPGLTATHRSLFDGSLQGIECNDRPAFAFQGHPEASPGPHDIAPLFDKFIALMSKHKSQPKPPHKPQRDSQHQPQQNAGGEA